MLKNTSLYILEELQRRNVEAEVLDEKSSLMRYKSSSGDWRLLRSCVNDQSSAVGRFICDHKDLSLMFARSIGIPQVPDVIYEDDNQAEAFMRKHKSIVVKPVSGAHGHGVTVAVTETQQLKEAVENAKEHDAGGNVLLQQMVQGQDVRLLVLGGRFAAAVRRVPAGVTGDGKKTLRELIEQENETNQKRVTHYTGTLRKIDLPAAEKFLRDDITRIPRQKEYVQVVGTANTSMGGHAVDATDEVPQHIIAKVETLAEQLHLPTCGVDFLIDKNQNYYFIEINSSPGFGPHLHPHEGKSRNVTKMYVDYLLST